MENKDSKNNLFLLTIVAIVAIVAIVIMIAAMGSRTYDLSEDSTGQAAKVATASLVTEGKNVVSTPSKTKLTCSDSDGGKNYYVKGTIRTNDPTVTKIMTDFCRNYNSSTLVEYYCDAKNIPASEDHFCDHGCMDGACMNETVPVCGDGVRNGFEECDGNDLGGMSCTNIGSFSGGILGCRNDCTFDTSNCDSGYGFCGDNLINNFPNEQCDTVAWGNIYNCADFGFTGGTLTCNSYNESNRCIFDTGLCQTPAGNGVCGDQILNKGEQCELNRPLTLGCTDFGYNGGTLSCDYSTCMYDVSQCIINVTPYCGDGIIQPGEQCEIGQTTPCSAYGNYTNGTVTCNPSCQWDISQCYTLNCVDTDNGLNYYIYGTVIYYNDTTYTYTDYCNNNSTVIERYCTSYHYPAYQPYNCPFGCSGGICLNQTVTLKPDLIVEDILLYNYLDNTTLNNNVSFGTPFYIVPRLKNIGNLAVNSYTAFIFTSIGIGVNASTQYYRCTSYSHNLQPGESINCGSIYTLDVYSPAMGTHPVNSVVDMYNGIPESEENNNERTEYVNII